MKTITVSNRSRRVTNENCILVEAFLKNTELAYIIPSFLNMMRTQNIHVNGKSYSIVSREISLHIETSLGLNTSLITLS